MANIEWAVAHQIETIEGTLDINVPDATTGRVYRIAYESYKMIPSLRVTQDNISQADGSVLRPRWKSGLTVVMQVALNIMIDPDGQEFEPACESDAKEMADALILHLNSIRKIVTDNQRLIWTPSSPEAGPVADDRMLTSIELLQIWDPSYDLNGLETLIQFAVETPFPYAIDATQSSTDIDDGDTVTLSNGGTSPFSPVIKVFGPTDGFTITNYNDIDEFGDPLKLVYDKTRPGGLAIPAAHYGEIDFFQGTIFKDGSGADLIAGIDPTQTDFFHLNPGDNDIEIVGADCTVLYNNAWA